MDLQQLQAESRRWRQANFPENKRTALHQLAGVTEEVGELAHSVLKMDQAIRGSKHEHIANAEDAIGDIIIYLCGLADALGLDMVECVEGAWYEVEVRDWVNNPTDGS